MNDQTRNGRSPYIAFYLLDDARAYREQHGGWLFIPEDGMHPLWFNTEFTISKIMTHPATHGRSGRVGAG